MLKKSILTFSLIIVISAIFIMAYANSVNKSENPSDLPFKSIETPSNQPKPFYEPPMFTSVDDWGDELTMEEDSQNLPWSPGGLIITVVDNRATIQWNGTGSGRYYSVYKKCNGEDWSKIKKVKSVGDNKGIYQHTTKHKSGCEYSVSVIDIYGNESEKSKVKSF